MTRSSLETLSSQRMNDGIKSFAYIIWFEFDKKAKPGKQL
jgi:hypothetical protein